MEQRLNFWVIGGDRRQVELAAQLSEDGHTVYTFGLEKAEGILCETNLEELHKADCVILPLPAEGPEGELNAPLAEGVILTADVLGAMEPGQLLCAGKISKALQRQAEESGLLVSAETLKGEEVVYRMTAFEVESPLTAAEDYFTLPNGIVALQEQEEE